MCVPIEYTVFDVQCSGNVVSRIASIPPAALLATVPTTFALKPMFVPETIVMLFPLRVDNPSREILFVAITIERIGVFAVFAPTTTPDNPVYAFAAAIVKV